MNAFPAVLAAPVTLSDTTDISPKPRALYIGVGGDVVVQMTNGDQITFKNAVAGSIIPISVKRVLSTGTVASSIVALY
jgi:hypothetical protein